MSTALQSYMAHAAQTTTVSRSSCMLRQLLAASNVVSWQLAYVAVHNWHFDAMHVSKAQSVSATAAVPSFLCTPVSFSSSSSSSTIILLCACWCAGFGS